MEGHLNPDVVSGAAFLHVVAKLQEMRLRFDKGNYKTVRVFNGSI